MQLAKRQISLTSQSSTDSYHNIGGKGVDKSKLLFEDEAAEGESVACEISTNHHVSTGYVEPSATFSRQKISPKPFVPLTPTLTTDDDDSCEKEKATRKSGISKKFDLRPPKMTAARVRDLLRHHMNQERRQRVCGFCHPTADIAEHINITDIHNCHLFHYHLQTVIEKREAKWTFQPFRGECDDEEVFESDPAKVISDMEDVWNIQAPMPPVGDPNSVIYVTVPWTSAIKPCYECLGQGQKTCDRCHGTGWAACKYCVSTGLRSSVSSFSYGYTSTCQYCDAHGKKKCEWCGGLRSTSCRLCEGTCRLKFFLQMRITWIRRVSEEVVGDDPLPPVVRKEACGNLVYKDEAVTVSPVCSLSSPELESTSTKFLLEHSKLLPNEKIVEQSHEVHALPMTTISYSLRKRNGILYIYGWDERLYAPNMDGCHLYYDGHCCVVM